ncbi:hypothetical protein BC835DRAFT_1421679 [Cytidiella melzeri]|nr:hypothetical protein BC835DRAFT_1421679 [Cytidiella melzeri]
MSAASSRNSSPTRPPIVVPPPPPMSSTSPSLVGDQARWMPPTTPAPLPKKPARPDYSSKKKHVPRPPNAFMLFRSMMINTQIPKIENRQQNVSRIAGEIWNKLDEEIKKAWHAKAEEVQREHKLRYPEYKFTPSRKVALKQKEEEGEGQTAEDYIRHLREKYTGVMGPAVAPTRKRKPKSRKVKFEDEDFDPSPKITRSRSRRGVSEEPSTSSSRQHVFSPAYPLAVPQTNPSLPPWRAIPPASTYMPGSSTLDLLLTDEYNRMASHVYGGHVSAMSVPQDASDRMTSRRKGCYDDDKTASTAMSFGHIPMPSPYNTAPGAYGTFTHNMLGLAELALPHANFYQPFYAGPHSFPANTPAPTPSEAPASFAEYGFTFPEELLANIVGDSGCASTISPLDAHAESSYSSAEDAKYSSPPSSTPPPVVPAEVPSPETTDDDTVNPSAVA